MKCKFNKFIIALLLVIGYIISSPNIAYAADANVTLAGELSGNENASELSDFNGNTTVQYIFKLWSVFKSLGYTDEQVAGIMGCIQAECNFHAEVVETHYDYGHTEEQYNEYVNNYSQPFADDTDSFTVQCLKTYDSSGTFPGCGSDDTIAAARQENDITNNNLNEPTYFVDGIGYVGVGLCGYTGERCKLLIDFAKTNNVDWYNIDNQLIWAMMSVDQGGDSRSHVYEDYASETASKGIDDCTHWFATKMINGNFQNPSEHMAAELQKRQQYAQEIYKALHGKSWDSAYGTSIVSGAGLQPSAAKNGINDKSIIFSYASNALYYPINTGFILRREDNDSMHKKNMEVYKGYIKSLQGKTDNSNKYSLYELFGEDLHWYRYLGEATYAPQLLDHIWSAIDQNRISKLLNIKTIDYEAHNYLSCHVYEDRPDVLTIESQLNGYKDPRVTTLASSWFSGYFYVFGSFFLTISKYLVSIFSLLVGHELLDTIVDIITKLESTKMFEIIKVPILLILGFAIIGFIISLVGKGVKYAKGQAGAREVLARFIVGVACLGMLFASVERPDVFNNIIVKTLTVVDQLFEVTLTSNLKGDEIIDVNDDDLAVQAAIWKTAIFNSWCRGQFGGREYDQLYTNMSGKSESKWMPMARETAPSSKGKPFYNTSNAVHEELVLVPIGNGKKIYNWAAYLYSCGSKYHIDSSLDAETAKSINLSKDKLSFPMAKSTANDSLLFADTFRVVDAQMDIAPQLYENGSKSNNYTNAHWLNTKYASEGIKMFFNTILLAFMIPLVYKKLKSFLLLLITSIKMIYFTILELFKEHSGWDDFLASIKKDFTEYFVSSLKINLMISLYLKFVDKGILMTTIYIILCLTILNFKVEDAKRGIQKIKYNVSKFKNYV